jgi:predicted DNA-binding transcriptional regulator AlpA
METLNIPTENDIKKWVKQGLVEYFENHPIPSASGPPPIADPFLNRKQVAGMFEISLVTLHDWMNKGLPFHKRGGRVYFVQSEVVEYVKAGKRKPSSFAVEPRKTRAEMFK